MEKLANLIKVKTLRREPNLKIQTDIKQFLEYIDFPKSTTDQVTSVVNRP